MDERWLCFLIPSQLKTQSEWFADVACLTVTVLHIAHRLDTKKKKKKKKKKKVGGGGGEGSFT